MSLSRLKPATLCSEQDLVLHLPVALRDFIFLSFLAPWYCGREVGLLRDLDVAAFFVAWLAPDQQPELNPSKRQRPQLGLQHIASMPAYINILCAKAKVTQLVCCKCIFVMLQGG